MIFMLRMAEITITFMRRMRTAVLLTIPKEIIVGLFTIRFCTFFFTFTGLKIKIRWNCNRCMCNQVVLIAINVEDPFRFRLLYVRSKSVQIPVDLRTFKIRSIFFFRTSETRPNSSHFTDIQNPFKFQSPYGDSRSVKIPVTSRTLKSR